MFDQITILGPGLLGASIGMASKARGLARKVVTWSRRAETRAHCLDQPWCDAVFEQAEEACRGSQFIVICTPVETIAPLLASIANHLEAGTLVTDVGSTKSRICHAAMEVKLEDAFFIGSHPMAGSEQTGMAYARSDLFVGAACIVTPTQDNSTECLSRLRSFWEALGMRVAQTSPEQHDAIVAHISHLPHLLASALCSFLATKDLTWRSLSGSGLRDTTRIASGDPELWRQIMESNSEEILRAICGLEDVLDQMKSALIHRQGTLLSQQLQRGKQYRDQLKDEA